MKNHAIRWMAEYRTAVQVGDKFDLIKDIIESQDVGCESLIATLQAIINQPSNGAIPSGKNTLRLELALIKDACEPIATFSNHFEGDGFLAPYAYDRWNDMNDHLRVVVERYIEEDYPSTCREIVREISPDDIDAQQILMQQTVNKAILVAEKLDSDSLTRFRDTLKVLRGCRLLGYQFVKDTTLEALEEEVQFVQLLPIAVPIIDGLIAELKTYRRIADDFNNGDEDGWSFWRRYYTSLPLWYRVAAEVALVMCSSASVERVFSLLNCMFDEHQQSALNDYKEASIKIRYNENYRDRKQ
jgi:hAT family C-terminal dimerisation region